MNNRKLMNNLKYCWTSNTERIITTEIWFLFWTKKSFDNFQHMYVDAQLTFTNQRTVLTKMYTEEHHLSKYKLRINPTNVL